MNEVLHFITAEGISGGHHVHTATVAVNEALAKGPHIISDATNMPSATTDAMIDQTRKT